MALTKGTIGIKNDGLVGKPMAEMDEYKRTNKVPVIDSFGEVMPLAKQMIGFDDKFHAPGESCSLTVNTMECALHQS